MLRVHHCPRCALRFLHDSELRDHLIEDHGLAPEQVHDDYERAARRFHGREVVATTGTTAVATTGGAR